ncbi:MAG: glutamate racemase [Endomicrobia bacterium]|nr:glutamate racemase [Endomicrobiia bacterium]
MKNLRDRPIGIFDSGVGGLTVVKEIINNLQNENIVYLGDTARVPYGNKSKETIIRYSIENTKFLLKFKIKLLVIACNTSSSYSVNTLKKTFKNLSIIDVVTSGAKSAVKSTLTKKVGVIGTKATISSNSYLKAINKLSENIKVYQKATPLFVPLIEEGWIDKIYYKDKKYIQGLNHENILRQVATEYLAELNTKNIDTLILGCTHYPAIKMLIQDIVGKDVRVIDSAIETAKAVKEILEKNNLFRLKNFRPKYNFFVTDDPENFIRIGHYLLGREIKHIKKVTI